MKKLTAILLALALLLSLTACGDALAKLKGGGKDSGVEAREPDIPGTAAPPSYDDAPLEEYDPTMDTSYLDPEPDEEEEAGDHGGDGEPAAPAAVTPSHTDVTLFSAGEEFTLSAKGISGVYASSFASKNPEVAEVDAETGVVKAVAPGTTTVTMHVECEGQYDFDCIVRCRWEAELPDEDAAEPSLPAAPEVSLSGFFSTLQGQYEGLGMMMAFDGALLDNYYPGLTDIAAVEEVLIQETAISIANIAVGLVRLSDSATTEDILAVQSILQSRIAAQADGGAFYPESCETWKSGVITSVSNCVGMFVYPDGANSMANLFTETFGG